MYVGCTYDEVWVCMKCGCTGGVGICDKRVLSEAGFSVTNECHKSTTSTAKCHISTIHVTPAPLAPSMSHQHRQVSH